MLRALSLVLLFALACGDDDTPADASLADASLDATADAPDAPREYEPEPFEPTGATRAYCPRDADAIEARITEALRSLTIEEKVALMHGARVGLTDGVWLVRGNERFGFPGLRMLDGPRGLSAMSGKTGTAFPVAMLRGATWDPELERRVGAAIAREHRSAGADVVLAPTINVLRHPRWGRAQETYSEDVHHLGAMGVAFIEGVQSEDLLASVKHYAANSIEDTRHEVDVQIDERTLREVYLPHFRRAVQDARVASVMSAYNSINGAWADQNEPLLRDILKGEWGFQGFVESDWIWGTHGSATSVRAGLDLEMPSRVAFRPLIGEVRSGALEERYLDDAVRRIVRAQLCYGLDERTPSEDPSARETEAHRALAREVARRGIVLLRNEEVDGVAALPLAAGASIALVGLGDVPNIGDDGSSSVRARHVVTALEGLSAVATVTDLGRSLEEDEHGALLAADAVVAVVGLVAEDEGEATIGAGDRATLAMPEAHVALVRALASLHERVIVIVEGGAAVLVEDFEAEVEAILWAGYPGQAGGHAIADVLFGAHAPSGRLPFSWPRREADLPPFDNTSAVVTYDFLHGYRHLDHHGAAARYPFGFGRSYATFAYANLRVTGTLDAGAMLEVEVDVTNEGETAAVETVQLYVSALGSAVPRAPRDLRAFAQVELAGGATETVRLRVEADELRYWDVGASAWVLEPIDYELAVGRDAADLRLRVTLSAP